MVARLAAVSLGAVLLWGCGVGSDREPSPAPQQPALQRAALTAADVDVPAECQGLLGFANTATFETLDVYLPSNVASNLVGARPYSTLAALSAVNGMGPTRLTQLHQGATAEGLLGPSCVGVYDELAVSADDQAAMVGLVNTISDTELHDIMPNAWNGAVALLLGRPYSSALAISSTSGVGPVSFRSIRNAATLSRPFEELAAAVTALHREARVLRHFDWFDELMNAQYAYYLNGMTCFGVDPAYLPNGTEIRPTLATPAEVLSYTTYAVNYGNRYHQLTIDPAIGLANLQAQLAGKTFFGCYISYANDPWSGHNLGFFVDAATGYSVLAETWWVE